MTKRIPEMYSDTPTRWRAYSVAGPPKYHTAEWIAYVERRNAVERQQMAAAVAPALTTPNEWNGSYGNRAEKRQCVSCDGWFVPVGNQITCSEPCREQRRREVANRNYKPRPLADRTCVVCGDSYQPLKPQSKTCSPACSTELERRTKRESRERTKARKERLAS